MLSININHLNLNFSKIILTVIMYSAISNDSVIEKINIIIISRTHLDGSRDLVDVLWFDNGLHIILQDLGEVVL